MDRKSELQLGRCPESEPHRPAKCPNGVQELLQKTTLKVFSNPPSLYVFFCFDVLLGPSLGGVLLSFFFPIYKQLQTAAFMMDICRGL